MMTSKILRKYLVPAALISALVVAYAAGDNSHWYHANAAATPVTTNTAATKSIFNGTALVQGLPDFVSIADKNGPAVVNITVLQKESSTNRPPPSQLDENDPFFDFFRRFQIPMPQGESPVHGMGSGFVVGADGYILTNAHVITNASEVTVKLTDRREFKAKVVGADLQTDVAVIKIDAKNLPTVVLGDPNKTRVGEWVLAIGSPFGFENSVTAGIVSAKSRTLSDETYVPFIQTDVAVNPGNSGGPLLNMNGEVIGINSQIYSRTGGYQGLSFAIPIDIAIKVKDEIIAHGRVIRGRLGITIQEVTPALAESFGLKQAMGALIDNVERGSPAAKADLQTGDIIMKFNGKPITRSAELPLLVSATKPGASATLEVWRKGSVRNVEVKIGELNEPKPVRAEDRQAKTDRLGLVVRSLTAEEQSAAQVSGGLLVEQATGSAADAGIQEGDIVISFNGTPVKSAKQLRELVSKSGKHAAILIARDGAKTFVPVELR